MMDWFFNRVRRKLFWLCITQKNHCPAGRAPLEVWCMHVYTPHLKSRSKSQTALRILLDIILPQIYCWRPVSCKPTTFQCKLLSPLTSSLSRTDTLRVESEAGLDVRGPLTPSSRFSLLASVSITAAFSLEQKSEQSWLPKLKELREIIQKEAMVSHILQLRWCSQHSKTKTHAVSGCF